MKYFIKINNNFNNNLLYFYLKKLYNLNKNSIKIIYNKNKKPYIINNKNIFFNKSHYNKYVFYTFNDSLIGCDVIEEKEYNVKKLKFFCTKEDYNFLYNYSENINFNYTLLFSLKESYIKLIGGNSNDFYKININFENDKIYSNKKNIIFIWFKKDNYIFTIAQYIKKK